MAILRMLTRLDRGEIEGLRDALDTPRPDEDIFSASDRWLSTLSQELERSERIQNFLKEMEQFVLPLEDTKTGSQTP
jgi:hypothetical protein